MRKLMLILMAVVGCGSPTAPRPDLGPDGMLCVRKGDTVGVLKTYRGDSVTVYYLLAQRDTGCH